MGARSLCPAAAGKRVKESWIMSLPRVCRNGRSPWSRTCGWPATRTVCVLNDPEMARAILPGQFLMIRPGEGTDPLLGRPFALYDVTRDSGWSAECR